MKLSKYEQETIINFNAGETDASLYTLDSAVMKKMDKLVAAYPDIYHLEVCDSWSKTYSMPKSYINYRKPRNLSDEQRAEMRERMKRINEHDN